jgi:gliding motility-associated lipoprotein GldB
MSYGIKKTSFFFAIFIFVLACSSNDNCIDSSSLKETDKVTINIERLEQVLFRLNSVQEVDSFITSYPVLSNNFLGLKQYPSSFILAKELYKRIKNPYVDTLYNETLKRFGNLKDLTSEFEDAFSHIKHYNPSFVVPKIKTIITGFGSSEIYVSKDQIIIGLEYYLGKNAKYRPPRIPQYILKRYDKSYIVPAVILLYATNFLKENSNDQTMLADMIYYGKKFYFAKQMMPCTPDSLLIWYSNKELIDVQKNKNVVWYHFLKNELLYNTNHFEKRKYMSERPNVSEIGEKCPGRVGSWIGWDIINMFMKNNPSISLHELMENPDAKNILNNSKYKVF